MPIVAPHVLVFELLSAVVIAVIWIFLQSLAREPARQRISAIVVAGAGAAYLNGGLGVGEIAYVILATIVAYHGLSSYRAIGFAWVMHTVWDVVHHMIGHPILALSATSSAGCAVTDSILAMWFFAGAPGVYDTLRDARDARGRAG